MFASWAASFGVSFLCHVVMDLFNAWQAKRSAVAEGRAQAVAEGASAALETVAEVGRVEAEAARVHGSDASDAAFDQDFRRSS